jgi:hypothetical protein
MESQMPKKILPHKHPTYFHCAPIGLGAGSTIQPGNWGRVMHLYEWNPNNFTLSIWREALLEQARQIHAPTKPSRLTSTFALASLQEAIAYRAQHCPTNLIYEVAPFVESPSIHEGDYEVAIFKFSGHYFQQMLDFGRQYWTVPPQANREVLFDCPLRVLAQHQAP